MWPSTLKIKCTVDCNLSMTLSMVFIGTTTKSCLFTSLSCLHEWFFAQFLQSFFLLVFTHLSPPFLNHTKEAPCHLSYILLLSWECLGVLFFFNSNSHIQFNSIPILISASSNMNKEPKNGEY